MKEAYKTIIRRLATMLILPALGGYSLSRCLIGHERAFPGWSQAFALLPGMTGVYLRHAFYRAVFAAVGDDVHVGFGTVFSHFDVRLGRKVYIGAYCVIGAVTLEDDVLVGSQVSIMNGSRQHGIDRLDVPIREQPGEWPRVTIGRDSWIGDRAVIMADVGTQCVVGAGSVVTKPLPARSIAVGNPARVVRMRGKESVWSICDNPSEQQV